MERNESRTKDSESAILRGLRKGVDADWYSCGVVGRVGLDPVCFGNRRPGAAEPVDPRSLFEVASLSKTMTAMIAARLWDEGMLDIDAPFTGYLPDHVLAAEGTKITIRHLAAHCSGFSDGWRWSRGSAWPFRTPDEFEAGTLAARPVCGLGERMVYACHNMVLVGFAIERVTGLDLDAAARKYVWGPLGMDRTTWRNCPESSETVQMYTHGPIPPGLKGDEIARGFTRPLGNAGVFTCADDLMRFAEDLLARRAFPSRCYDLLFAPFYDGPDGRRSFGWDLSEHTRPCGWSPATIAHTGYTGQLLAVDPVAGKAGFVLTNLRSDDAETRAAAYAARLELLSLA